MRNRLVLVVALAVLGLALGAAMVAAKQQTLLEVGEVQVEINLPDEVQLPDVQGALPACSNLKDDDGDGTTDLADPGCSGPLDKDEAEGSGGGSGGGKIGEPNGPENEGDKNGDTHSDPSEVSVTETSDPVDSKIAKARKEAKQNEAPGPRSPSGEPTNSNPTLTIAQPGPAPIGVPNFVIDRFAIPPFLLPIYQACGTQYEIPWPVLASINRIETAFGTNLNVSSAGAVGWMQFLPSTWKAYGVDANKDGRKDPYNPVDAICGAARYLRAAGGEDDLRSAIFAYNHADWYVDEVLLYAKQYGNLPPDLVGSLTGLTEGAHFPVAAKSRYADDISEREAAKMAKPGSGSGNVAEVISDSPTRRGIDIYAKRGSEVVAVNDGVIRRLGENKKLGRFIVLEDAYGNRFTYAGLGEVAKRYPAPKRKSDLTAKDFRIVKANKDSAPTGSATGGDGEAKKAKPGAGDLGSALDELLADRIPGYDGVKAYFSGVLRIDSDNVRTKKLRQGSKVVGGTPLGELGKTDRRATRVHFEIRPAGRGAGKIDPKPILDGWKLLEATAIYRAAGKDPFAGGRATVGQILLASKAQLQRRVLNNPNLEIYRCGRSDIRTGTTNRRVLAAMEFLALRGFRLTVTSLRCGHGYLTKSGNVSHHSSGNAMDIAKINGIPVLGNQGKGSITHSLVLELLELQGNMEPSQIITLMEIGGPTFAMADHADHVHVGWQPAASSDPREAGKQLIEILKPGQWDRLINRLEEIEQPKVRRKASKYSLPAKAKKGKRASKAHAGE